MENKIDTEEWDNYRRSKARSYLSAIRSTQSKLIAARDEVIELRDTMDCTGSFNMDGMPHSPSVSTDAMLNLICALDARCEKLNERIEEYKSKMIEADAVIASLNSHPLAAACIQMHYLQNCTYSELASKFDYSETHIRNSIIPAALLELYSKMPTEYRDYIPTAI